MKNNWHAIGLIVLIGTAFMQSYGSVQKPDFRLFYEVKCHGVVIDKGDQPMVFDQHFVSNFIGCSEVSIDVVVRKQ